MNKHAVIFFSCMVIVALQTALMPGASSDSVTTKDFTFADHKHDKAVVISPMKADDAQPIRWASASFMNRLYDCVDSWIETFDTYDSLYMSLMGSVLFWAMVYYFQRTRPAFVPAVVPVHPIIVPPVQILSPAEIEHIYMNFAAKHTVCGA